MARRSLSRRVTLFITMGFTAIWLMAAGTTSVVVVSELREMFDQQLVETAHVLLPLLSQIQSGAPAAGLAVPVPTLGLDEALVYRLIDARDHVLAQSPLAAQADLPPTGGPALRGPAARRMVDTPAYRTYTTPFNLSGHALQLAAPVAERREATREGLTAFLVPMLALLPLTYLVVGWIARRSLAPLQNLHAEIAARDGRRLDAIDAGDGPEDLVRIVGTLNGFMARLSRALDGERAFAGNAAHELRTPVAIALAQVQHLQGTDLTPDQQAQAEALERALQRMRRLVARLLQLARADAGVGTSGVAHDLVVLSNLVLDDLLRGGHGARRVTQTWPAHPVMAHIDPDAYAIILGNLVENALQHGTQSGGIAVVLTPDAVLEVSNDGPAVAPAVLAGLTRRFSRRPGGGFGLGLHICDQILRQSGGRLDLFSPVPGRGDGFMVRATLNAAS